MEAENSGRMTLNFFMSNLNSWPARCHCPVGRRLVSRAVWSREEQRAFKLLTMVHGAFENHEKLMVLKIQCKSESQGVNVKTEFLEFLIW